MGVIQFISHDDFYKPEEGKEYLKDDTLKFKVTNIVVTIVWRVTTSSDQIALHCRLSFVPAETVYMSKCESGDVHVYVSCISDVV